MIIQQKKKEQQKNFFCQKKNMKYKRVMFLCIILKNQKREINVQKKQIKVTLNYLIVKADVTRGTANAELVLAVDIGQQHVVALAWLHNWQGYGCCLSVGIGIAYRVATQSIRRQSVLHPYANAKGVFAKVGRGFHLIDINRTHQVAQYVE